MERGWRKKGKERRTLSILNSLLFIMRVDRVCLDVNVTCEVGTDLMLKFEHLVFL